MSPAVSICIPVYNMARFLPEAVESVLGQTCTDIELLIADNASTDGTYEIALDYARRDSRVRVVRNDTNIGANPNFAKCFDLVRGEWLKFVCADDWLGPDCIERMLAASRPGVFVMTCNEEHVLPDSMTGVVRERYLAYGRNHYRHLSSRFPSRTFIPAGEFAEVAAEDPTFNCISVCTAMFHRDGIARYGRLKPDLITLNDWELSMRIGIHTGLVNALDAVAYYRVHGTSLGDELVRECPFKMDILCPLMIRHEAVYSPMYAPLREAARRKKIDLRYDLFDASRHAREDMKQRTPYKEDSRAAADWDEMVKHYPGLLTVPLTYYPTKLWRAGLKRLRPTPARAHVADHVG
jgi:glycosyltransferase involved in cell wall biosynthesis